jgi:signal transduction histidine kinase
MLSGLENLTPAALGRTAQMLRAITPAAARLERQFADRLRASGYDQTQIRALCAITPAAASRMRRLGEFLERVDYNGRLLAKLNVAPIDVSEALRGFAGLLDPVLQGNFAPAREQLHLATILTLNEAYYRVREAEAQALFRIYRAEGEAAGWDDLLQRFVRILTPALGARAGRILAVDHPLRGKLARPAYIRRGRLGEALILDPAIRGRHASYWSYPLAEAVVAQFGFAADYPWMPRELALLDAVAERCRAAADRQRMQAENRRLETEARCAEEEERRRIGRELHDETGQALLLLRLQLEMMERDAPAVLRTRIAEARRVAETAVVEIRRIMAALNPDVLERLGLAAALRQLVARFQKNHPAHVRLRISRDMKSVPPQAQEVIYRVVQECLHNAARHSRASALKVSLRAADSFISVSVSDNGSGFDVDAAARKAMSFGLAGMRERAALLGGALIVKSAPGKGTTVNLRLPRGARRVSAKAELQRTR